MNKFETLMDMMKANELLKKKEEKKKCNGLKWVIAIVLGIAVVAAIAYGVYRYFKPDYLEDFEDEFEDEYDDFDDEDDVFEDDELEE